MQYLCTTLQKATYFFLWATNFKRSAILAKLGPIFAILRVLEGLAFRDSFPLRFACGPLPSSGDEVSFGKTLKPASNSNTVPDVHGSESYSARSARGATHRAQARRQCAEIAFNTKKRFI